MAAWLNRWFKVEGLRCMVCGLWCMVGPLIGAKSLNPGPIPHPYYISVAEINHNSTDKTLEISCKIFTTDFEVTLEKNYKTKVDLVNPKDKASVEKLINDYIKKHLSFKVDSKPVSFSYVGYEKEEEAIYSYFQIDNIPSLKKLDVTNSILHDFSDQQINIIHCTVNGKRQSTKLDYPNTQASFGF